MIQRLRKRFIRIAMLSVALVLLALTLIVNIANFVSTNRDINEMLDLIYEGPDPAHLQKSRKPARKRGGLCCRRSRRRGRSIRKRRILCAILP